LPLFVIQKVSWVVNFFSILAGAAADLDVHIGIDGRGGGIDGRGAKSRWLWITSPMVERRRNPPRCESLGTKRLEKSAA
jgi:hypothetical protein